MAAIGTIANTDVKQSIAVGGDRLELRTATRRGALNRVLGDVRSLRIRSDFGVVRSPRDTKVVIIPSEADRAGVLIVALAVESLDHQRSDIASESGSTSGAEELADLVAGVAAELLDVVPGWELAVIPITLREIGLMANLVCESGHESLESGIVVHIVVETEQLEWETGDIVEVRALVVELRLRVESGHVRDVLGRRSVGADAVKKKVGSKANEEKPGQTLEVGHVEDMLAQ